MKITKNTILTFIFSLLILASCTDSNVSNTATTEAESITETESLYKTGSICTVENGDGDYGVAKVLVIEDGAVHVKIYKNKYKTRPTEVDLNSLSLGSFDDPEGFGIGHIPLQKAGFDKWNPEVIATQEVAEEELEGYNIWKNQ